VRGRSLAGVRGGRGGEREGRVRLHDGFFDDIHFMYH
jgi:hypothetical protein